MIKKILGIDCSSTCIGYAVLLLNDKNNEITFSSVNYIKPTKDGLIVERLADTRDRIKKIIEDIEPDYIAIEDIIMFIRNMSTAQTIVTLASFNRMVSLVSLDYLGNAPTMYGVLGIRHALKPGSELPSKEDMPELVAWHLNINFPYEYNKKSNPKIENLDKADAIAVALTKAFELGGKTKPNNKSPELLPKTSKKDKEKKKAKKNGSKKRKKNSRTRRKSI